MKLGCLSAKDHNRSALSIFACLQFKWTTDSWRSIIYGLVVCHCMTGIIITPVIEPSRFIFLLMTLNFATFATYLTFQHTCNKSTFMLLKIVQKFWLWSKEDKKFSSREFVKILYDRNIRQLSQYWLMTWAEFFR